MNDLLAMFNLEQSGTSPTHQCGHIVDWFVHRPSDGLLVSTEVTQAIASDRYCVRTYLDVTIPPLPPALVEARDIRAIDRQAFKADLHGRLSASTDPSAAGTVVGYCGCGN